MLYIIRTYEAAKGKAGRLKELLKALVEEVQQKEPHVIKYTVFENSLQEGLFFTTEIYPTVEASLNHMETDYFTATFQAINDEGLLLKVMDTKVVNPVARISKAKQ